MLRGIDISNWQGRAGINLSSLPQDVRFVICRATEGISLVDEYCADFINVIENSGRKWGFYHFALGLDPIQEAEWFVYNCKNWFGHGMPVLDMERDSQISGLDNGQWCEEFANRVHELTGVWCVIYCSALSYLPTLRNTTWLASKCPLWIAGYPYYAHDYTDEYPLYDCSPWKYAFMWQFTSQLHLPGYAGDLDGDMAYILEKDWDEYCGGRKMKPEEIAQAVWGYDYKNTARGGSNVYDQAAATYDLAKRAAEAAEEALKIVKEMKEK